MISSTFSPKGQILHNPIFIPKLSNLIKNK